MYPGRLAAMRAAAIATAAKAFTWAEYAERLVDGYIEAGARLGGRAL
jgi:hypothetical protein